MELLHVIGTRSADRWLGGLVLIILSRDGVTGFGHTYREFVSKNGDGTFTLEVQSTNPEDNFSSVLSLEELFEYQSEAHTPFEKTVITGGAIYAAQEITAQCGERWQA